MARLILSTIYFDTFFEGHGKCLKPALRHLDEPWKIRPELCTWPFNSFRFLQEKFCNTEESPSVLPRFNLRDSFFFFKTVLDKISLLVKCLYKSVWNQRIFRCCAFWSILVTAIVGTVTVFIQRNSWENTVDLELEIFLSFFSKRCFSFPIWMAAASNHDLLQKIFYYGVETLLVTSSQCIDRFPAIVNFLQ